MARRKNFRAAGRRHLAEQTQGQIQGLPQAQAQAQAHAQAQAIPEMERLGHHYARSARLLSLLPSCVTPRDALFHLLTAVKWLVRDAADAAGRQEHVGADLLFPLLVGALVTARVPCMHLVLHFLTAYGDLDHQGEAAYYATCLHAAVEFLMRLNVAPAGPGDAFGAEGHEAGGGAGDGAGDDSDAQQYEDDVAAVAALGDWLREQQTVEDARVLLQQEGWMF